MRMALAMVCGSSTGVQHERRGARRLCPDITGATGVRPA